MFNDYFIHLFKFTAEGKRAIRVSHSQEEKHMAKKLVAFFSASGITKKVAETIAEEGKFDLYEITPKEAYTKADLDWMDKKSRSSVEMNDKTFRPQIAGADIDISAYDEIILGFPIWWYVAPTIINTFLEAHDFTGKKIVLFATSGGSVFGNTVKELQPSAPGAVITEGKVLNNVSRQQIKDWLKTL